MIYKFQVATAHESQKFLHGFEQRLRWIKEKGYLLEVDTHPIEEYGDIIYLQLQGNNSDHVFRDEDIIYIFKHQLSEMLAEHILNDWESKLAWKEIVRNCKQVSTEDRKIILDKTIRLLKSCNDNESLNLLMNFGRKNRIAHQLLEYISHNNSMVVEGFINFCMRDYLTEIKFAVDLAVEELKNEKEYSDFIKLLRYFVDTQTPKTYEVNLMMDEKGLFYLWDGEGIKIEENYMSYYMDDILFDDINLDDVLISILITIAPRKIVLHNIANLTCSEALEMIKSVFKEKIELCSGCERCLRCLSESDQHQP